MNSLRDYIAHKGIDATHALNLLQDHGVVSDECVSVDEVGDAGKAVAWLAMNEGALKFLRP